MKKIVFENGIKTAEAKVTIDNIEHQITPAVWSGKTPITAHTLNLLQDNVEQEVNDLTSHKYHLSITATIADNSQITLPFYYKVRI